MKLNECLKYKFRSNNAYFVILLEKTTLSNLVDLEVPYLIIFK